MNAPLQPEKDTASCSEKFGEKYKVPALERGLRLLQEFGRDNVTLGAPELARRLQLPRATVFRMLNTLEAMEFLQRTENGNDYRLGLAVLRLGFEFLASLDLTELGQPVIDQLSAQIALPGHIVVRDGRFIVYVAKVAPPSPFASSVRVGTRLPAHATMLGHALLGDMSLDELRHLYPEEHLQTYTAQTPRTVEQLFNMVSAGRERGYLVSEGFFEHAICTVAAPVRDHSGAIVAALGTTVAAPKIEPERLPVLISAVCQAATQLSQRLNYRPAKADNTLSHPQQPQLAACEGHNHV